ncbi:MAG: hypothetical protein ACHQQQ_15020, partial [Bacteroidota bacterium]
MIRTILLFNAFVFLATVYSFSQNDTVGDIIWYPKQNLSGTVVAAFKPQISAVHDTVHVTWNPHDGRVRLPYVRSTDGGATFEPMREMLTDSITFFRESCYEDVKADGNDVYLIFQGAESYGGVTPIHIMNSIDRGSTWGEQAIIDPDITYGFCSAALCNSALGISYENEYPEEFRTIYSGDGGSSWFKHLWNSYPPWSYYTQLSLTPGILHMVNLVGHPGPPPAVYVKRSYDMGSTWVDSLVLSTFNVNMSADEDAIGNSTINGQSQLAVGWRDTKYGPCQGMFGCSIVARASDDGGKTWMPERLLSTIQNGYNPNISIYNNIIACLWSEESSLSTSTPLVAVSIDGGLSYFKPFDLSPPAYAAEVPKIAVTGNTIHCVWEEQDGDGFFYIAYRRGVVIKPPVNIDCTPVEVSFNVQPAGTFAYNPLSVKNTDTAPLTIYSLTSNIGNFLVNPIEQIVLQSGQSQMFTIEYAPSDTGANNGTISILHSASPGDPLLIPVSGTSQSGEIAVNFHQGTWNLISTPLKNQSVPVNFPSLFRYENGYVQSESLSQGVGYWMKLPEGILSDTVIH